MHYFEKMIVKFAGEWRVSSTPSNSFQRLGACLQTLALSFNAKDLFNASYSPSLTSFAAWPSKLKRRFYGDSVLWRSKEEAKWGYAPPEAGLGGATTHFIQPLNRAFKLKLD